MTEKMQAKLNELEIQQTVIKKVDDLIQSLERDKDYSKMTYEHVKVLDENGNPVLNDEGKEKWDWQSRYYTEEELEDHPEAFREIEAYDIIIKALEKLV